MSSIGSSTGDVPPEVNVIDHRNPRTPERRPFRPLTPIGPNASPTLSEGFIRDYLSPGTAYIPGLRCSSSPITKGNPPSQEPGDAEVWSCSNENPGTPTSPHYPPRWPTSTEGETSPASRLRWINDFVPHTLYKPSTQRLGSYATGTLKVEDQVLDTEARPPNNAPLGLRTRDRHSRAQCITPGQWNSSPILRDCSPTDDEVLASYAASLYRSGELVPGAAHSKQGQQKTADQIISVSEASRTHQRCATEWLVETEGDDVSLTPRTGSMDMHMRDDDRHGATSIRSSQKSAPHVGGFCSLSPRPPEIIPHSQRLVSKAPRFTKEYLSNLFDDIEGCVWPAQDDVSMSNVSEDDESRSAGGCLTSGGYNNGSGGPNASQLDPSLVKVSLGSRDNPIIMDSDTPAPEIPLGRQGYYMTDEEFFRYETPGPGYQTVDSLSLRSSSFRAPISNKRTATMHHHCDSADSVEVPPSLTHGHRRIRSGPMEIQSRTEGHTTGTNKCSEGEVTATTNEGRTIDKKIASPPVVDKRVQALIDEGAQQPALWTPTPHWVNHIPGTDIVMQRGPSGASGAGISPVPISARRGRSTARRSRATMRPGDRTAGSGHLGTTAIDSMGPSSAISTRRRMVTSPTKRRQESERDYSGHANPGAWNNDDLPEEHCKEDTPEDEPDCN